MRGIRTGQKVHQGSGTVGKEMGKGFFERAPGGFKKGNGKRLEKKQQQKRGEKEKREEVERKFTKLKSTGGEKPATGKLSSKHQHNVEVAWGEMPTQGATARKGREKNRYLEVKKKKNNRRTRVWRGGLLMKGNFVKKLKNLHAMRGARIPWGKRPDV